MCKKHLYQLNLGGISIYVQGVTEEHVSVYMPTADGIKLTNLTKVSLPLDEDMWDEINELICSE